MVNRRRQRETRRQIFFGIIIFGIAFAVVIGVAVLIERSRMRHPVLTSEGCPEGGPSAIYAIVLDSTDAIGDVTRSQLRSELLTKARAMPQYAALELYVAGDNPTKLLKPVFKRCNPGDPSHVSWFDDNPKWAKDEFEQKYILPFSQTLDRQLVFETTDRSPIFEGLQAVSIAAFPAGTEKLPRTLILVSDLLQNSPQFSVYKSFRVEQATEAARYYHAALGGVDVEIFRISRRNEISLQLDNKFGAFWTTWFAESGASLQSITPLQGMN